MRFIRSAAIAATLLISAPAYAGEFGVSNSYSSSWRHGHGTQTVDSKVRSSLIENGKSFSAKTVHSSMNDGQGYSDNSSVISINSGSSHLSETTRTNVKVKDSYSFGSESFNHRTGSYFAQ